MRPLLPASLSCCPPTHPPPGRGWGGAPPLGEGHHLALSLFLAAVSKAKMSTTPAEKSMMDTIDLFHKFTDDSDTIDKEGLLKLLQENFPNFLSACVSWDPLPHIA